MAVWSLEFEGDILKIVDISGGEIHTVYVNVVTWLRTRAGSTVPCTPAARAFIEKYYLQCELSEDYFNPLLTR